MLSTGSGQVRVLPPDTPVPPRAQAPDDPAWSYSKCCGVNIESFEVPGNPGGEDSYFCTRLPHQDSEVHVCHYAAPPGKATITHLIVWGGE